MGSSGRCSEGSTDESGRRLGLGDALDLGDHRPQDPTYGFEECSRRIGPRSLPRADVDLDAVGSGDGLACVDDGDGAAEPAARELTVVDEAASVSEPSFGEQVETFVQAALGLGIEVGGALRRAGTRMASLALAAALPTIRGTALNAGLVEVANDGGEVAIVAT